MNIKGALELLDPEDGSLWTKSGLPKLNVIEVIVGEPVIRQDVTDADPEFCRSEAAIRDVEQCSSCSHLLDTRCQNSGQIMHGNDHCSQYRA
ncbi:hypothetical protein LCGC14_1248370 [marine sediment metagenome]|uniref:Uncharacterized protein n=1 Tax=marine sediment metagenome TaxID=412755 RepID=A0A0F9L7I8_9ZZZZ